MRRAVAIAALALAAAGCWGTPPLPEPESKPPDWNLVLLSIDTLRRDHLSFYGYERDTAPNLAALAREGVVFDDALAAFSATAPSHASMLTGLYPDAHGIRSNGRTLDPRVRTLQEILRDRGYHTAGFISGWTLGRATGLGVGFDVYDAPLDKARPQRPADETWAEARRWLEALPDATPFFLFIHFYDPHYRYEPPEEDALRFLPPGTRLRPLDTKALRDPARYGSIDPETQRHYVARYDGEIRFSDRHAGHLFDTLRELGLWDRSLVVVLSDHGETLFERERPADHGARVYDEQIRIPLLLRLPESALAGQRLGDPVHQVDLFPSVLELLGLPVPTGLQGRSFAGRLRGEGDPDPERARFSQAVTKPTRLRHIPETLRDRAILSAIRVGDRKLIEYPTRAGGWYRELFDLSRDPGELANRADEDPELADRLGAALAEWRERGGGDAGEPLPALSPETLEVLRSLGYVE